MSAEGGIASSSDMESGSSSADSWYIEDAYAKVVRLRHTGCGSLYSIAWTDVPANTRRCIKCDQPLPENVVVQAYLLLT